MVGTIPWRRQWQPTPVFLPGESPGQRSLAGYSPWGHKELDTTEQLSMHAWGAQGPVMMGPCPPTPIESGLWWEMRLGDMTGDLRGQSWEAISRPGCWDLVGGWILRP